MAKCYRELRTMILLLHYLSVLSCCETHKHLYHFAISQLLSILHDVLFLVQGWYMDLRLLNSIKDPLQLYELWEIGI